MARFFRWFDRPVQSGAPANKDALRPSETKTQINPMIALHGFGEASWSGSNYGDLTAQGYMHNPVVYRCVRMIAEAASTIPQLAFDGEQELETHPILALLKTPNPRQSTNDLLDSIFASLLTAGNAYLLRIDGENEPAEIHLLNPGRIHAVIGSDGWPQAYEYNVGGKTTRYYANEEKPQILHMANYSPLSDFDGMSPLHAAHRAFDIHNASSQWNKALLDNSARPSGALVYASNEGANLTPDQFERLKSELENNYAGASNNGRPMLLDGGLDWKPMALSPKDMDFIELRNGAARDIALAFGVPPMLLGIPGDNTFSNYSEANRVFWRQTVLPLADRLAAAITRWLAPHWQSNNDNLRLSLDRDAIEALSTDREALWKRVNEANFLTRNEKRLAAGYGELDGDDLDAYGES